MALSQPSDAELFLDWSAGDVHAGGRLFERHHEEIARFFRIRVPDHSAELCQRTFLACVEAAPGFRAEGSFRSFLFGIAQRQLYRYFRERAYERERVEFQPGSIQDLEPMASSILATNEEERLLHAALRRLPREYQLILGLHYWEELSARACAEILEIPLGTAKTRLRRARQLLEREFAEAEASPEPFARACSDLGSWARELRAQLPGAAASPCARAEP